MIFVEACRNCKFDKVVLPDSVEIIDKYAFSRSWNLKEVEGGKNVERIRDYAFFGCINLKHFTFHARLRGIGGDAFNNTSMSEINLPEGLRTIGPGAFNTVGTSKGFASCAGQSDMYEIHIPSTEYRCCCFPECLIHLYTQKGYGKYVLVRYCQDWIKRRESLYLSLL